MRIWQEQLAFEASEKKRMRAEWVQQAAGLRIGITRAASDLGLHPQQLRNMFRAHNLKNERTSVFKVTPSPSKQFEDRRRMARMKSELRSRAAKKISAGYKPEYARREAALEMQMEATR